MYKNNSLVISAILFAILAICSALSILFATPDGHVYLVCIVLLPLSIIALSVSVILLTNIVNLEIKAKNKKIIMNSNGIQIIKSTHIEMSEETTDMIGDEAQSVKKHAVSESDSKETDLLIHEEYKVQKPKVTIETKREEDKVIVKISADIRDAEITYCIGNNNKILKYQQEFSVSENCSIKAVAKNKNVESDTVEKIIDSFVVSKPSIIEKDKGITINCSTPNSRIYYTLDGKEPTKFSSLYKGFFFIKKSCTIKARAFKDNHRDSDVCIEDIVVIPTKKDRIRLFTNEENVIGISYRGNSHLKSDTPCQDYHSFSQVDKNWAVAIVSDGAGSAKNSDQGSRAVCAAFKFYIENLIKENESLQQGLILDEKTWDIEFRGMINQFHKDLKDNIVTTDITFDSLAATIILLVYSRNGNGFMFAHIGDGRAAVKIDGEWRTILTPHKGSEANQTVFCTSQYLGLGAKSRPNLKMSGAYVPETKSISHQIDGFVLMSDGCENGAWVTYQKKTLSNGDFIVEDVNLPRNQILNRFADILEQEPTKREELTADFISEYNDAFENEPDDKTILIGIVK